MYLVLKNNKLNTKNIVISYKKKYNNYIVNYKEKYLKINGIALNIDYNKYTIINNLYYIFINNKETLDLLHNIEHQIQKYIIFFYILRKNKNETYIICNNYKNININNNNININIKNIKYLNNNYVPIINII